MKKVLLTALLATAFIQTKAQMVTDTVSIDSAYAKQVWYSLPNGEQGNAAENNWDLGFDVSGMGASVMINSAKGAMLWKYPNADTAGWSSIDTIGLSTWTAHWNSDTSWTLGAIGSYVNSANPFDLDWGLYNINTHIVTGDSLYIIKLVGGAYKKLWIQSLSGSTYSFIYADLDGNNPQSGTLNKANYTGKNFGYYSLQANAALDREPLSANWDLVFTQYTGFVPIPYTVTGVLSNNGVQVAKCSGIANTGTYTDYSSATFNTAINTIGYDWKSFNGTNYTVADSLLYFVKPASGDIWKVIFTGFGGSANGDFIFSKEKMNTTAVTNVDGVTTASLALYPNPSNGQTVSVVYSFTINMSVALLSITDIAGRTIVTNNLDRSSGLHQYHVPVQNLKPGMYLVNIETGNSRMQQKLIVQ